MRKPFTVIIRYANGSKSEHPFSTYSEARDSFRRKISYSGGRVERVEVGEVSSLRAVWDSSWNAQSKAAGLRDGDR